MEKRSSYFSGLCAEVLCRAWLMLCGYRIVASRYKSPLGEIDIIAAKSKTLAIIEVKFRPSEEAAIQAISPRQRGRLERATKAFISFNPKFASYDVRFDAMLVYPPTRIKHIKNAWHGT